MTLSYANQYARLPLCIDEKGHKFTIEPATPRRSVCTRCGLIRERVHPS